MKKYITVIAYLCLVIGMYARPANVPAKAKYNEKDGSYTLAEKKGDLLIITIWDKSGELGSINRVKGKYSDTVYFYKNRWYSRFLSHDKSSVLEKSLPPETKPKSVPKEAEFNFDLRKWEHGEKTDGQKNGVWKLWWVEGSEGGTVNYSNGVYQGKLHLTWENGKTKEEVLYENNLRNGKLLTYYENGAQEEICDYKEGKRDGLRIGYNEKGELAFRDTFVNGKVTKRETFDLKYGTEKEK